MAAHAKDEAHLNATIPKHIRLFEAIHLELQTRQLSLSHDPIKSPGTKHGCKLCIGPCTTTENGFYYDAIYCNLGLKDYQFKIIESGAFKVVVEKQPIEVTRDQALEIFSDDKFKASAFTLLFLTLALLSFAPNDYIVEIINNLAPDETITVYRCGPLVDLYRACLEASSAYWRGGKNRKSLQSVYGISYPDQKSLKVISFHMLFFSKNHSAMHNHKLCCDELGV
ncbi:putative threonine--tRNA ligase [Medicago truncatula]|uniref:Putative threonine--tRNA ligase n=1 Tax=Medicago truncatula TaxID=3880 RepID=A0A396IWC2_MEDTR|nr:putative threonine--tRNA ligase [Medicago truncatula]